MSKTDRKIVAEATPGPWVKDDWGYVHVYDAENDEYAYIAETYSEEWTHFDEKTQESNAQFIAHFNPSKVLELLDTIDAQAKRIEELKWTNKCHKEYIKGLEPQIEGLRGLCSKQGNIIDKLKTENERLDSALTDGTFNRNVEI